MATFEVITHPQVFVQNASYGQFSIISEKEHPVTVSPVLQAQQPCRARATDRLLAQLKLGSVKKVYRLCSESSTTHQLIYKISKEKNIIVHKALKRLFDVS